MTTPFPDLLVVSPEGDDPRELAALTAMFAAGLQRYHVRKPRATEAELARWLGQVPERFRLRLVLHQHHELVERFGLGGRHWRDDARVPGDPENDGHWRSRSCHTAAAIEQALGRYDAVLFAPVFRSLSKPGHGPGDGHFLEAVQRLLATHRPANRRTAVYALGGITAANARDALALGFDGVAVLGAVWREADPVSAFSTLQSALSCHAA